MNLIFILVLIISIGLMNILCFLVGAKTGQKIVNGKEINIPKIPNPKKIIEDVQASKEYKIEQESLNTMLDNINNYDGTGLGQKDID